MIISPEAWSRVFVSKHNYAVKLGELENKVFFLNPPSSNYQISKTDFRNVFEVDYKGFIPYFRFFPKGIRKIILRQVYKKIAKISSIQFDVIWSFDNSVFFDFDAFSKSTIKISHIVDLNQDFEFAKAAKSADICLGVTSHICSKFRKFNKKTYFINHGAIESSLEQNDDQINYEINQETRKLGYAGNLDIQYLDWSLIKEAIAYFENVQFFFAGPCKNKERIRWFENKPNVTYLGILKSKHLLQFYKQMDVLMICYKADEYKEQLANPHKLMGYLASGRPIVSTYTEEFHNDSQLIAMSEFNKDWIPTCKNVLDQYDFWNSAKEAKKRIQFAENNSYENQILRIDRHIQEHFEID